MKYKFINTKTFNSLEKLTFEQLENLLKSNKIYEDVNININSNYTVTVEV